MSKEANVRKYFGFEGVVKSKYSPSSIKKTPRVADFDNPLSLGFHYLPTYVFRFPLQHSM